jgi:hypothetical protein
MSKNKNLIVAETGLTLTEEVAEFFTNNASVGSDNLSSSLPQLKVTEANSKNEGVDDKRVAAGNFYYAPTKQAFKELEVSILTISRGFYALDNSEQPKPKFNQMVGGMILESNLPFVMFVSGTRLENMWNFGKDIKPLTKAKPVPVPMFALKVKLSLDEYQSQKGINHVVVYDLVKDKEGKIQIITDSELLRALRSSVDSLDDVFESFIEQKEVDKETGELLKDRVREVNQVEAEPEEGEDYLSDEEVEEATEGIPF